MTLKSEEDLSIRLKMLSIGDISIVFINFIILCNDYVHSLSRPMITDLGDLNFEATWEPLENYTGMYNITSDGKNLCYTNKTSCFLGGALLEDKVCPLITYIGVTLEADGQNESNYITNRVFRVGSPNIILPSEIYSTNITIEIQGRQTPLYYDENNYKCRGESSKGEEDLPIYMGQREVKSTRVQCNFNLTDLTGSEVTYELKIFYSELSYKTGKMFITLHKLKPFSNYSISIWCTLNDHIGPSTVYNFTTREDIPSSGPSIVKPSTEGLGCDKPDLRNISFNIQPPPVDQRHGVLQLYEISYRIVTTSQDEGWHSEILELPSPPPPSMEVTLEDLSRWDAYEVRVFANNSVGGMSSSVHQFEVLKSKQVQSRPQNLTTKEIKPRVWLLKWDHPWSTHTGDCIINYVISTGDRTLGTTNTTSYQVDSNDVGPVYSVKVTPMIYNGTGPAFKGAELSKDLMLRSPLGKDLIIVVSVLLAVFLLLLIGCAYLCVQHGPRSTQPFDISNNPVLKAAFAMGDFRPKIPEREEYDTVVGVPPPPPPAVDDEEDGEEGETIALMETPPAGRAGGDAVPRPPNPDQSPPHSTDGSLSEECDPMVAMEMGNGPIAFSSSSSLNVDGGMGVMPSMQPNSKLITVSYEDSLGATSSYPSLTDSGYVQSPPPQMQPTKPAEDGGYFRFDDFQNIARSVSLDNEKYHPGGNAGGGADERSYIKKDAVIPSLSKYTDSGYVAGTITPQSSASGYPLTTPYQCKYSMMKAANRKQSSIDSEDTATSGSLSPSDSETGDGVGTYTKLSQPNTPLSPRSKATPCDDDDLQNGWDIERNLNSIQYLLHQLNDQVQHPGLSNVG